MMMNTVPRWLRYWSIATLVVAGLVVLLGSLITTFRVGMSDPVWPTEPWFLVSNNEVWFNEPAPGFLIEHTHRLVAWSIGIFAVVLALGAWATEPNRRLRWAGFAMLVWLLLAYLALHGEMGSLWRARKLGGGLAWPAVSGFTCLLAALGVLTVCVLSLQSRTAGRGLRVLAALGLMAVMIQGLLGGYRVFLDQLMGTQLAAIHGSFGQVTLALLTAVMVACAPRRTGDALPEAERKRLAPWAVGFVCIVVMQLIWGVWVRHMASPVAQRLHLFTAFVVSGTALTLIIRILASSTARPRYGFYAYHLIAILAVQVYLGVEAYIGKFAIVGPEAMLPPNMRSIDTTSAVIRTSHTLLGALLLVSAVALMTRLQRKPVTHVELSQSPEYPEPQVVQASAVLV
jgi:heme a synthase